MIFANFTIKEVILETAPGSQVHSVIREASNFAVDNKCHVRFYHNSVQYLADSLGIVTVIKGE